MLKVTGRVSLAETGEGIPGLHVKAVDKDLFFDDVLGTAITDADGRYEIAYEKKDFSELFEKAPDLYLIIRDAKKRILYSSEDNVRYDAGANETMDVTLSRAQLGGDAEGGPYGPNKGKVKVRLAGAAPAGDVRLYFTEHRPVGRKQHVFVVPAGQELSVDLPTGEYTAQVQVRGHETVRGLVTVNEKGAVTFDAALAPRRKKVRTFAERLSVYGIDASTMKLANLEVPRGETVALDWRSGRTDDSSFRMLQADSIAKVKEWTGSDDARFGHDRPVYGPLPDDKILSNIGKHGREVGKYTREEVAAAKALAREYVYGNAKAVAKYEPKLKDLVSVTVTEGISRIPLYIYKIVTINAGSTLVVGNGSAIFECDELRIHKTGKLKPVNNVTIKIGTWKEFQ